MVPGGGGHDAPAQLLFGEGQDLVHGPPILEGAGDLHAFGLDVDLTAQIVVQGMQPQQRRFDGVGRDALPGRLNIVKRERHRGTSLPFCLHHTIKISPCKRKNV